MKYRLLTTICLLAFALASFSQEYIAGIKGAQGWSRSELASGMGYGIMIQNDEDNSVVVLVMAFQDGHFDVKTSPLGVYLSDSGTTLITDSTLPYFTVGGKAYSDVHYIKHKARMGGTFANIELWQLNDNSGIEYSILALAPVKKNQLVKDFISQNLMLLPLPKVTEDDFIQSVESVNTMLQQADGAKMSGDVKMTSAIVDRKKKEFIRTFQFYPWASGESVRLQTTEDFTNLMVTNDAENTPLVKNAITLGYSIVVVWNNKDGKPMVTHKFDF